MQKKLFFSFVLLSIFLVQDLIAQSDQDFQKSILMYVNQYRIAKNLPPLQLFPKITAESIQHSKNMALGIIPFSHDGFNGRANRLIKNISQANSVAENVAYGKLSAKEVVEKWIQSSGHRKNIEGKFNLTGIGVYRRHDGYLFYTQIFVNKP